MNDEPKDEPRPWNAVPPPSGVREGYPKIEDPSHTLWDAQEAGWPDHLPHEAWAAVVAAAPVGGFVSSAGHPAFDEAYIGNAHAVRPKDEPEVAAGPKRVERDRR
jgi:hypothetical protein